MKLRVLLGSLVGLIGLFALLLVLAQTTPLFTNHFTSFDRARGVLGISATCSQAKKKDLRTLAWGNPESPANLSSWPYALALERCGILEGMSRREVVHALGRSRDDYGRQVSWTMGSSLGFFGPEDSWPLTVWFDQDDRVMKVTAAGV